ncbi:MAG: hypothetical protein L0191_16565, partial [Acidobacteria bacterium]|nr:hypothetical protein [Acidobacteriota bacterium]
LKVVSRRGYFARKEKPAKEASKDKKKTGPAATAPPPNRPAASPTSAATARDPAPAGPRPPEQVEVTTYFLPGAEGKLDVPVAVALPLDLLQPKEGESGSMTLTLRLKDAAGQIVDTQQESVDPARFYLIRPMKLSPGSYLLGILLEAAGKKVYEANEAIVVPAEMGKRFGMSSIVPVLPTATTGSSREGLALRPTPTLNRGEDAYLYFLILPGEGSELSEEGTAIAFTIYKGEQEIRSITTKEAPKLTGDGRNGYPILLRIPTADLSWGRHRIELSVTNSRLGRRATGEIELTFQ